MLINLDIDICSLDQIEQKFGKILLPNVIAEKITKKVARKRNITSRELILWQKRISLDNQAYIELIENSSDDALSVLRIIENSTSALHGILQKLDQGISIEDVSLIANASWIRENTSYEPLIITDDSDLLASGHVLSSFFGISIGFLSSYEILRLVDLDAPFVKCCNYYGLNISSTDLSHTWSKEELENHIAIVLQKGKLACHPNKRVLKLLKRRLPS